MTEQDALASALSGCRIDQSFYTAAPPHKVLEVWEERVATYGLHVETTRARGLTKVTVRLDGNLEVAPRDKWGVFITAFYGLALVWAVFWLATA